MRVGGKRRSRGLSGHRQRTVHTTLSNFASVHTQVTGRQHTLSNPAAAQTGGDLGHNFDNLNKGVWGIRSVI